MKLLFFLPYIALITSLFAEDPSPGFKAIFNGKDLTGWNGEPGRWTVEEGAITGTVTPDNPLKTNSFLVWQGGREAKLRAAPESTLAEMGSEQRDA